MPFTESTRVVWTVSLSEKDYSCGVRQYTNDTLHRAASDSNISHSLSNNFNLLYFFSFPK